MALLTPVFVSEEYYLVSVLQYPGAIEVYRSRCPNLLKNTMRKGLSKMKYIFDC
jgi:hypothetical protein